LVELIFEDPTVAVKWRTAIKAMYKNVPLPWFMSKCNIGSSDMFIYLHIFSYTNLLFWISIVAAITCWFTSIHIFTKK
jgi:hypothetical protein